MKVFVGTIGDNSDEETTIAVWADSKNEALNKLLSWWLREHGTNVINLHAATKEEKSLYKEGDIIL